MIPGVPQKVWGAYSEEESLRDGGTLPGPRGHVNTGAGTAIRRLQFIYFVSLSQMCEILQNKISDHYIPSVQTYINIFPKAPAEAHASLQELKVGGIAGHTFLYGSTRKGILSHSLNFTAIVRCFVDIIK